MKRLIIALVAVLMVPTLAWAQGGESAGMITEIKVGKGKVEVKSAGKPDRPAGPFLALRVGDSLRATDNAFAVVLLTGGRGTVKVEAANSPYTVAAGTPAETKLQKAQTLVAGSVGFLSSQAAEPPKAVLSVRAGAKPSVVLSPRNTAVLPGPITFEWLGTQFARYTVRVTDAAGATVLEKKGVVGAKFAYPADAPVLKSGTKYTLHVEPATGAAQQATFEIVDANRAEVVRQNLREIVEALGPKTSLNTVVAIQTGTLAEAGLLHDARLVVLAALAKDPDEPSLHTLLGQLYQKSGLADQAAESFDEAQFLLTKGAN
jgi:hypothetical protein